MMDANVKIGAKALIRKNDKFLILKKTEKGEGEDIGWETPGGHMDKSDESLESCLIREVSEETGLSVNFIAIFGTFTIKDDAGIFVGVNYLCECQDYKKIILSTEHSRHHWATIDEIHRLDKCIGLQKEIDGYLNFKQLWIN